MEKAAIAIICRGDKYLGIKRSQTVRAPGKICFPGGQVEIGESVEYAVIREIREELGVAVKPVRTVWTSVTTWHVEVHWILADIVDGEIIRHNEDEVEWFRWMELDELRRSDLLPSNADFLAAVANGTVRL